MARDICEVIDRVLEVVPEEEYEIHLGLIKVKKDVGYRPPELRYLDWKNGSLTLQEYITEEPLDDTWQKQVSDIWMGN